MGSAGVELRQALLRCAGPSATWQDQEDCAALLRGAGLADAAQALRNAVRLQAGFSADATGKQPGFAARPDGGSTVELGIGQLTRVMALADDLHPMPPWDASAGQVAVPAGQTASPGAVPAGFVARCEQLCVLLRGTPGAATRQELGTLLGWLRDHVLLHPGFDARHHVGAELPRLGLGVAFECFRRFLRRNAELAYEPFGSAGLFHAAARLEPAGLGAWFRNAAQLVRNGREVLGLVQLVAGTRTDGRVDVDALERWSVLLSQHMPEAALRDLVEELADIGAMRAIRGMCERIAERPDGGSHALQGIRDAGLDHGELGLALRAQKLITQRHPRSGTEWIVLGEIEATAGNGAEAERAFVHGLQLEPGHAGGRERLSALRAGLFRGFEVRGGFGTPPRRRMLRRRRHLARQQPCGPAIGRDSAPRNL